MWHAWDTTPCLKAQKNIWLVLDCESAVIDGLRKSDFFTSGTQRPLSRRQTCAIIPNTFPLITDPDQNKVDTSFIFVVACSVYILLSRLIQFCLLPNQNFEKNVQDPADTAEPWIQDPSWFLPIFRGVKSFHQRNHQSLIAL